jgi:hypothetical protein
LLIFSGISVAVAAAGIWLLFSESSPGQGGGLAQAANQIAAQAANLTNTAVARLTQALDGSRPTDIVLEPEPRSRPAAVPSPALPVSEPTESAALPDIPIMAPIDPLTAAETPLPFQIPEDANIYTMLDINVVPPQPLYELFRPDPLSGPSQTALVEFVVNEEGFVQVIDLIQPGNVVDSMMLAAVKAWRFQPALRDGRPVKYRAAVRLNR